MRRSSHTTVYTFFNFPREDPGSRA